MEKSDGRDSDAYRELTARLTEARSEYDEVRDWCNGRNAEIRSQINEINDQNGRYLLAMATAGEGSSPPRKRLLRLDEIVDAYPANRLDTGDKLGIYLSRWWEYLSDEPREANSEGGVFPAIFGTVLMTLMMALAVVPFGVLAALYLREYAKAGFIVSAVRIAVNNLAGVPSIVFGVFGLGFFCYGVGSFIDGGPSSALPVPSWFIFLGSVAVVGTLAFFSFIGGMTRPGAGSTRKQRSFYGTSRFFFGSSAPWDSSSSSPPRPSSRDSTGPASPTRLSARAR